MTLFLEVAVALVPARAAPAATTAVALHDDDGGAALFGSDGLHPGRIDRACVSVSAAGATDPASEVRLTAEVGEDDLAPYLAVTVERGTVEGSGTCASFVGEPVWSGTLADFPGTASAGIPTGWHPARSARVVYRFTVTVLDDPRAQLREASATFVWTLVDPGPPAAAPGPTTATPTTPAAPTPTAAAPSSVGSPATSPPPSPSQDPEPPTASRPPGDPSPDGPGVGEVVEAPAMQVAPTAVEQVTETALALVRDGHFPLLLVTVLSVFLMLQGALDRRDPKLALARTHQELREFRQFPDAPRIDPT